MPVGESPCTKCPVERGCATGQPGCAGLYLWVCWHVLLTTSGSDVVATGIIRGVGFVLLGIFCGSAAGSRKNTYMVGLKVGFRCCQCCQSCVWVSTVTPDQGLYSTRAVPGPLSRCIVSAGSKQRSCSSGTSLPTLFSMTISQLDIAMLTVEASKLPLHTLPVRVCCIYIRAILYDNTSCACPV